MNACDVIGYVEPDGCAMICADCATAQERKDDGTGWHPIFGDAESDSPNHCERCEDLIPESWTAEGWNQVLESLLDVLHGRGGRLCILRQWYEHATDGGLAETYADRYAPGVRYGHRSAFLAGERPARFRQLRRNAMYDAFLHVLETRIVPMLERAPRTDAYSPKPT